MDSIIYRPLTELELSEASSQLTVSYRAAYRGLMRDEYLDSMQEDHWAEILRNSLQRGDTCLLAKDGGTIAGAAVCGKADEDRAQDSAELYSIYLLPEYIGRGMGHRLYCGIEKLMMARGYKSCILEVLTSNRRAVKFYAVHGYEKIQSFTVEENGMTLSCELMKKYFMNDISRH